jgi:hypothetical protein
MTTRLLRWEAEIQVQEALDDYLSEGTLQDILDIIYGKNMFNVVDAEEFKKKLFGELPDPII